MSGADTIFALSSAPGKAGVSVVRVSGSGAFASLHTLCPKGKEFLPRTTYHQTLIDPRDGSTIDRALVLPLKGPASFTGEDTIEYHLHGSPAVIESLLSYLSSCANHRPAAPGEFTRRAFENGKLDLTEAEAVADLINAETQEQKIQALSQMGGALSKLYEGWRTRVVRIMAYIEAVIDFPDEDIPDDQVKTQLPDIISLITEIESHLNDNRRGERLRNGINIAIIGAPNAGKSSLINLLSKRDIAIVSPMAGTTRDVLEAHLDLGGFPVILADTAGLRPDALAEDGAHESIESEGIRRAMTRAEHADLRLAVFDGAEKELNAHTLGLINDNTIVVFTKTDSPDYRSPVYHPRLARGSGNISAQGGDEIDVNVIEISCVTGDNVEVLLSALTHKIKSLYAVSRETPSLTRTRHRAALEQCVQCLKDSMHAPLPELMAEDVRMAARALGRITGRVDVEDLLDVIFRDFCIGK